MKRKRITTKTINLICQYSSEPTGGGSVIVNEQIDFLLKSNYEINVLSFYPETSSTLNKEKYKKLTIYYVHKPLGISLFDAIFIAIKASKFIKRDHRVISHLPLYFRRTRNLISYFHISFKQYNKIRRKLIKYSVREFLGSLFNYPLEIFEKFRISNSHLLIAVSERVKNELIQEGADVEKIRVIPNTVNPKRFHPNPLVKSEMQKELFGNDNYFVLLSIGRLSPLKGFQTTLKALDLLKGGERNIRFIIIGKGYYKGTLKKIAKKLNLKDSIIFKDFIPNHELYKYYNTADVTIISSFYESFGLTALEALACGCPVVSSDVGDIKDICQNSAKIFKPGDYKKLAYYIELFLENKKVREDMSKRGLEIVKRYQPEKIYTKLLKYL